MQQPLISVLMPAYNAEKYIAEAIESILNQTYKNFEFIIIDDASSDDTWNIILEYAKKDERIKTYRNIKNLYIAKTRNKLIKLAKGKYIAWQDADDISYLYRLKKQLYTLENEPQVGIIGGYLQFMNKTGHNLSIRKYASDDKTLRKNIFHFSPVAQPTAMIRKKCFDKFGLYNPKYPPAEDIDMSFRIGSNYQFANIPELTLKYREHNDSATFQKLKKIELATLKIRRIYNGRFGYYMNINDKIYNLLQYISVFIIPSRLKIYLFNKFRNNKL